MIATERLEFESWEGKEQEAAELSTAEGSEQAAEVTELVAAAEVEERMVEVGSRAEPAAVMGSMVEPAVVDISVVAAVGEEGMLVVVVAVIDMPVMDMLVTVVMVLVVVVMVVVMVVVVLSIVPMVVVEEMNMMELVLVFGQKGCQGKQKLEKANGHIFQIGISKMDHNLILLFFLLHYCVCFFCLFLILLTMLHVCGFEVGEGF